MIVGAATVFTVGDIEKSLAYYRDALGFAVSFEYGEPTYYAGVCRDEVALHLRQVERPPGQAAVCIFVDDVDALHAELVGRGAKVVKPPQDYAYGMRDFDVLDLDGNEIVFGMGIKEET